ncbi:MAG: DUF4835 family protein [Flavisolibacter sp.]|jgi:hypothetical protein|nr:DUF4835 family protein [Flavisolibacter sp.]
MIKKIFLLPLLLFVLQSIQAQELQANLTVMANRVSTEVDKKVFQTLQTALTNFLNTRKWTSQTYQPHEKIKCNFLVNIDQEVGQNVYKASLTVQAARPVFNSTYESPLLNLQDNDVVFRYIEFQPVEFNENRVQGNDPLSANLTAVLAYYVNIILGLDHASFSPRGGDLYFQKAQTIVNNAPESRDVSGWKAFDGQRNRFRMVENLTDNRFTLIHDALYTYYRLGLDQLTENEEEARNGVLNALNYLTTLNKDQPNSMIMQVFFQGKSNEIAKLFSKGNPEMKVRARDLLVKLDLTNASVYKDIK